MKTKNITLLTAIALGGLIAFSTLAQANDTTNTPPPAAKHRPPGAPRMGEKMAEELGLNAEQKEKFQDAMKHQAEQMRALSPEERKTKGKAIREATTEKIKAILTPEQFEKWQSLKATRPHAGPKSEPKPPGAPEKKD